MMATDQDFRNEVISIRDISDRVAYVRSMG